MGRKKVVIIDDNYPIREAFRYFFSDYFDGQLDIFSSENGVEGLGYIYLTKPDIVVLDSTLPKYSGRELVDFLRENEKFDPQKTLTIVTSDGLEQLEKIESFEIFDKQEGFKSKRLIDVLRDFGITRKGDTSEFLRQIFDKIIGFGNRRDVVLERYLSHKYAYLRLHRVFQWLWLELRISFLLIFFKAFWDRPYDSNIAQEESDLRNYRVRYYPVLTGFFVSIFFLLLQFLLFLTGGLVIMNTQVRSIFAVGNDRYNYLFSDISVSSGDSYELHSLVEEMGGIVLPLEYGNSNEVSELYVYSLSDKSYVEIKKPISYSSIEKIEEVSSIVTVDGTEVPKGLFDDRVAKLGYQISNDGDEWYYYSTEVKTWKTAEPTFYNTSDIDQVNLNISGFNERFGAGRLYLRVFFFSTDEKYSPKLEGLSIDRNNALFESF